jgi:hypothetical protein
VAPDNSRRQRRPFPIKNYRVWLIVSMLYAEVAPGREARILAGRDKRAVWRLGIASGLIAIGAISVRLAKRGPKSGVMYKRRPVNDGSVPFALESKKDESGKSVARRFGAAKRVESRSGFTDPPPLSVPENGANASPAFSITPSRTTTRTIVAIAVSLVLLALTAVYNAVELYRVYRLTTRLLTDTPHVVSAGAEEARQIEQRAWVGVSLPQTYPLTNDGGGFGIELRNYGKTPALQTFVTDYVVIEELDKLTGAPEAASDRPATVGTLMPGSAFTTDVRFKTIAEGIHSLSTGRMRVVNYALVTYEDIFHRKHTSRSCFYWHRGLLAALPCEDFNTTE